MPGGSAPAPGQLFKPVGQALTLEKIAASRGESFYRGDLAEAIVGHSRRTGGHLDEEDLAAHRAEWVDPISAGYGDFELVEVGPNCQGIAALMALGILRHRKDFGDLPVDSPTACHLQIEATKLALTDAYAHVADPESMEVPASELLADNYLSGRAADISPDRAAVPAAGSPTQGGTVYLTTADQSGTMVSFIQSNFFAFGSGIVVPGTGISLQNRGVGFRLDEGHPNRVAGGKRPFHTIMPGFMCREGRPVMSFGVMGGNMQPQGHLQVALRIGHHGQNPQAAIDAPRWLWIGGNRVAVEKSFDPDVAAELERRVHEIVHGLEEEVFGGAQAAYRLDDGYCAASDPRKDGLALGY